MLNMCCQMHKARPEKPRAAITHTANTLGSEQTCPSSSRNTAMHTHTHAHAQALATLGPDGPSPPNWEQIKIKNRSPPLFTALTCKEVTDRRVSRSLRFV